MKILIRPLDTKKKSNDRGVQRSVQEFWISSSARSVHHIKSMQNVLFFLVFLAHRDKRSDVDKYHDQRDRGQKHFLKVHLRKSMFFQLGFKDVSEISSNATGDVGQKSHQQRHWCSTVCFVRFVNGAGATSTFFSKRKKKASPQIGREQRDR